MKDYTVESYRLVESVRAAIGRALKEAENNGVIVSSRRWPNSILLSEVLKDIHIDKGAYAFMSSSMIDGLSLDATESKSSLGALLSASHSLKFLMERVKKAIGFLRATRSKIDSVRDLQNAQIDYFETIYHCLALCQSALNKSKSNRGRREEHFQEFCSLCWRLVDKHNRMNYGASSYSYHYCKKHHPQKGQNSYKSDRRRLMAALKNDKTTHHAEEKRKLLKILSGNSLSRERSGRSLHMATGLFSKRGDRVALGRAMESCINWQQVVKGLTIYAMNNYSDAYGVLKSINVSECSDWVSWFKELINLLDCTGQDIKTWKESVDLDVKVGGSSLDFAVEADIGWNTVEIILFRFQCVKNIEKIKRSRGPKKGSVATNEVTRAAISKLANQQIVDSGKINASAIARELNLSPQRVSKLLKALELR